MKIVRPLLALGIMAFTLWGAACSSPEKEPVPLARIKVSSGEYDRVDTMVAADVEGLKGKELRLVETTSGLATPIPCQLDEVTGNRLYFVLNSDTQADSVREFTVYEAPGVAVRPIEVVDKEGKSIQVLLRDAAILQYNYAMVQPPEGVDPIQARNAYIHPVWTPSGTVVTDDFNPDHLHQRGIWFAWTKTQFDGRTPDFWNLGDGTGTVRFKKLEGTWNGTVFAGFRTLHEYLDLSAPGGPVPALEETWDVRVFRIGGKSRGYYLFEIESHQRTAGPKSLVLPEYHYGGMAFRGNREWTKDKLKVVTSTGKSREEADGSREDWCIFEGPVGNGKAGAAVFSHPTNFRSPQPLRVHPEMPYFVFSPMRLGEMQIVEGEEYVSRYRYLVFDGTVAASTVRAFWNDFAHPPTIEVLPAGG